MICLSLASVAGIFLYRTRSSSLEQPKFEVLRTEQNYEVRRYAPYLVAETVVEGAQREAGAEAFRRLAGYIFGDNKSQKKMAMTAPVQSEDLVDSTKMAMTVPVTSTKDPQSQSSVYRFVMESKYNEQTLPLPNDERVKIRKLPETKVAVLSYSGSWSEERYQQKEAELRSALQRDGLVAKPGAQFARYNAPFTPSFLRHNEVLIELEN
jgi:hypothetical protein